MNRRQFVSIISQASIASMATLHARRLFAQAGHELPTNCAPPAHTAAKHISFSGATNVLPRKSVWDLSSAEVTRLKNAYQKLRELTTSNPNDPRGWMQQGNVHCFNCSGGYDPSNIEIHGSWWFLPWHRCYLHVHERILGKLIGDPTFRLAYWDWDTYPSHAVVPPPFMAAGSLFDSYRGAKATDVIPSSITGNARMKKVLGTTATQAFMGGPNNSGVLENSPHGPVHIWTGEIDPDQTPEPQGCFFPDEPGGQPKDQSKNGCLDMGVLATAAQDPLFFAHHSNIDRLWDVWRNSVGKNWSKVTWLNHRFNFYDENGDWVYITPADVIDQKEQTNLHYTYQAPSAAPTPATLFQAQPGQRQLKALPPLVVTTNPKGTAVGTKPHVKSVTLPPQHRQNLMALAQGATQHYLLHIDGLTLPPNESAIVDVYVGDPGANLLTGVGDSFVGTFSSVVPGVRHMHNIVRNAVFELSPEAAALIGQQPKLTVTLVPRTVSGKEPLKSSLTYRRIYLTVE